MLERALKYEIPNREVRAFEYACFSAFGKKLPIFSAGQLALCCNETILLLESREDGAEEEYIVMLLHSVADDGKLNVSIQHDDDHDVELKLSPHDLFNYKDGNYNIYYFPDSKDISSNGSKERKHTKGRKRAKVKKTVQGLGAIGFATASAGVGQVMPTRQIYQIN